MFRIHFGKPNHPTALLSYLGATLHSDKEFVQFTKRRIPKWYGISFKNKFFLGLQFFDESTRESREGSHKVENG